MSMMSFSHINRDPESAARTREILGLPEHIMWTQLHVEFGLDEIGEVQLTLIATGEQIRDLAELAIRPLGDDCAMPDEDELESALVAAADERPHSRACGLDLHPHGPECAVDCPTCRT